VDDWTDVAGAALMTGSASREVEGREEKRNGWGWGGSQRNGPVDCKTGEKAREWKMEENRGARTMMDEVN
jgi:hypothetical protein